MVEQAFSGSFDLLSLLRRSSALRMTLADSLFGGTQDCEKQFSSTEETLLRGCYVATVRANCKAGHRQ